jgi:hypothetical protein
MEKGADANAEHRSTRMTPLRAARVTGNKALVELLTQYGARK